MLVFAPLLAGSAPVGTSEGGIVVSADPAASEAGAKALRKGGNAIDALVATAYALSVVEPYSAGIGGGGFLIYRDAKTGKVTVLDYREKAPKAAHRDMYIKDGAVDPMLSREGYLAVGVPGMVQGFDEAQQKLGKLKLKDVLDPAIDLAEHGFRATPDFHGDSVHALEKLKKNKEASRVFLKKGEPYHVGELVVQKDLAKTLRSLKTNGPKIFTEGWVAKAIAADSKKLGGLITVEDLKENTPRWREPLKGTYRGHQILTMPPPSSGGTHLLQILGMLAIDREVRGRSDDWNHPNDLHFLIEAMRRAYADRATYMGDPAFVDVPVEQLLAPRYLRMRHASIDPLRATPSSKVKAGKIAQPPKQHHTTNIVVVDRDHNVVVCTQTINTAFGSGVVVPGTGILLNNEMDDFAAAPNSPNAFGLVGGEANSVQPGKIPLSSMTPTIVLKGGQLRLAVGAPGGSTIITTVLQIILHVIDYDQPVGVAVGYPRIHHQWLPDVVMLEAGALPNRTKKALSRMGHRLDQKRISTWGNASAVEVLPNGTLVGAADPRGDGAAVAE